MARENLDISFWRSDIGTKLLHATAELGASTNNDPPAIALKLKRLFPDRPAHELNGAIDLIVARAKAAPRLGAWVKDALLTTRSVEQASRPEFSRYRAERFRGARHLLEIGTASGFDTAALARVAERVTSLEPDTALADMARHNLHLQGITNVEIVTQTAEDYLVTADLKRFDALFADPSRRDKDGARLRAGDEYLPPLSLVLDIPISGPRGVKISPAVNVELPPNWEREFLGIGGECLEQTVWSGLTTAPPSVYLADKGARWRLTADEPSVADLDTGRYSFIYDPHPALVRSGSLDSFYAHTKIDLFDPRCAYGVSPELVASPFVRPFRIIDLLPYRDDSLAKRLYSLGWCSRTEIKKRGVEIDPDLVRRKLKLPPPHDGSTPFGTVLIGRRGDSLTAVLAERVLADEEERS